MKLTRCMHYMGSQSSKLIARFKPRETPNIRPRNTRWFPGHMAQGLKRMQMMARAADCIIEIHDARIPFTSRNTYANKSYSEKPRILLLNKADLVDEHELDMICKQMSVLETMPVLPSYITVDNKPYLRCVVKDGIGMANADQLTSRKDKYLFFVSGLPNTGKSTFINIFKKEHELDKNKLPVAPCPGVTKKISNKVRILDSPTTYIYDTPGVNLPDGMSNESVLKLAVVGCIPVEVPGMVETADYLLYWLNRKRLFSYSFQCGLAGPSNNIHEVLAYLARKRDYMPDGKPDLQAAGRHFLALFNKGAFGKLILEDCSLLSLDYKEVKKQRVR